MKASGVLALRAGLAPALTAQAMAEPRLTRQESQAPPPEMCTALLTACGDAEPELAQTFLSDAEPLGGSAEQAPARVVDEGSEGGDGHERPEQLLVATW